MATLKELYTTLKSLRDMNLPIDDKLTKAADELEGRIWQHKMGDYFIYVNMSNQTKEEDLRTISNYYGLGLKIETR